MKLTGKTIVTFVAEGVEELEYYVPLMRLQEEGATVLSAAMELKSVHGKNGLLIKPDTLVSDLNADELFGVILPGGWAPDKLRRYKGVTDLVKKINDAGKTVGVICHGGLIAISAGIVSGHRATGSVGIKDDLINAGATWVDEAAFRDGNQVWGRVVADIPAFCRELIEAFEEKL